MISGDFLALILYGFMSADNVSTCTRLMSPSAIMISAVYFLHNISTLILQGSNNS